MVRIPDAFFVIINAIVRFLLRSPLHGFWSGSLMLITYTGRKTKKVYTTPVRYLRHGEAVWAFTSIDTRWWRNLRGGAVVTLRIRGEESSWRAEAIAKSPDEIREALAEFLAHFPQDAPYYDIALDAGRRPLEGDLQRAAGRTVWMRAYPQPASR